MLHLVDTMSPADRRLFAAMACAEHLSIHAVEKQLWYHREGSYEHADVRILSARVGSATFSRIGLLLQNFEGQLLLQIAELVPRDGDSGAQNLMRLVGQYPVVAALLDDTDAEGIGFLAAALATICEVLAGHVSDPFPDAIVGDRWRGRASEVREVAFALARRYATAFLGTYHKRLAGEWLRL